MNVNPRKMKDGLKEYVKYETPFFKHQIVSTHNNLIEDLSLFTNTN